MVVHNECTTGGALAAADVSGAQGAPQKDRLKEPRMISWEMSGGSPLMMRTEIIGNHWKSLEIIKDIVPKPLNLTIASVSSFGDCSMFTSACHPSFVAGKLWVSGTP